MHKFIFEPPKPVGVPIHNRQDLFPVRRIFCVGKNYRAHVVEMGGDPARSTPIFFTKSRETLVRSGAKIPYPPQTTDLHFEAELVVAMAGPREIYGYAAGIDMTRRDLQALAKSKGGPWDMSKNFDASAPCGTILPASSAPDLSKAAITLTKDGAVQQSSSLDKMIWSVSEIIDHLGASVTLAAGDLIYTGTPHGVGPVIAGETLRCEVEGLPPVEISYI